MQKIIVKAVIGFIFKSVDTLLKGAQKIAAAIGLNEALFPSLDPKLSEGEIIIEELQEAVNKDDGSTLQRATVKAKVKKVQDLIRAWGPQVTKDANGSLEVLLKSGFDNIKQREAHPAAGVPAKVKVKDGENSGSVILKSNAVKYADKYQYRYTDKINPEAADYIIMDASIRMQIVKDLERGTTYYFSCRAYGRINLSDWSDDTEWLVR